jgi:hypothetical protein
MGFKLGAFLGGLSQTVAERVKEQENRVNLLTDKALDLGTQVYLQKKKETEADAKKIEQGMAALAMTGLDTPTRFQIASGGSTAVTNTLNQYNTLLEKNKDADFSTFYSVKNSEDYADMDDAEFLSLFGPKAVYDPSIARKYLEGREADGLGGLFVSDPTALLSEFEAKAGVVGDSRVETDLPALGQLSVDYTAMRSALGKKDETLFDTPKEAQTYYTRKILEEQNKPEAERDTDKIKMYESYVTAYGNIDKEAGEFDIDKRLDAIANERFELGKDPEKNADALAALEAEEKVYLESKAKRTPDNQVETIDTMIENTNVKMARAMMDNADESVINDLQKQLDILYGRKKDAQTKTTTSTQTTDVFSTPKAALDYIGFIERSLFSQSGLDFVQTFDEKLTYQFGDGEQRVTQYLQRLQYMDVIQSDLDKKLAMDTYKNSKFFASAIDSFKTKHRRYYLDYINQFNKTAYPDMNKDFNTISEARQAGKNNELKLGTIVRYKDANGNTAVAIWDGTGFY